MQEPTEKLSLQSILHTQSHAIYCKVCHKLLQGNYMKPKQGMYCALFTGFNICGTPESEAINLQMFCQILDTQSTYTCGRVSTTVSIKMQN